MNLTIVITFYQTKITTSVSMCPTNLGHASPPLRHNRNRNPGRLSFNASIDKSIRLSPPRYAHRPLISAHPSIVNGLR